MALYLVGDIQGCFAELQQLLQQVAFDPQQDHLAAVGDLVARGPQSLATLQWFQQHPHCSSTVLGNHDLHLLSVLVGVKTAKRQDQLEPILALSADQREGLIAWLVQQPLLRRFGTLVISHAGIYPGWSLEQAQDYAQEVSASLQQAWQTGQLAAWLTAMYGNQPERWQHDLRGSARLRFIINAFTRMRLVDAEGTLDFAQKEQPPGDPHAPWQPWFHWRPADSNDAVLAFGHWAALQGRTGRADIIGLDHGCVWGQHLTLMRWPDREMWQQPALANYQPLDRNP